MRCASLRNAATSRPVLSRANNSSGRSAAFCVAQRESVADWLARVLTHGATGNLPAGGQDGRAAAVEDAARPARRPAVRPSHRLLPSPTPHCIVPHGALTSCTGAPVHRGVGCACGGCHSVGEGRGPNDSMLFGGATVLGATRSPAGPLGVGYTSVWSCADKSGGARLLPRLFLGVARQGKADSRWWPECVRPTRPIRFAVRPVSVA